MHERPHHRTVAAQVFVVPAGDPERYFAELRSAGVDMVIVRAFHLEGDRPHQGLPLEHSSGAYFATRHVPLVADRLPDYARAAHHAGLRCLAWMTTRKTPMPALGLTHREVAWDPALGRAASRPTLDLFDPLVVNELADVYRDLARTGVDGVLFQDDLALGRLEGFSPSAASAWLRRTGHALDPTTFWTVADPRESRLVDRPEFQDFARFKRDRVLSVAMRLVAAAREKSPEFECALNLYYETATDPVHGLAWFSQELSAAASTDARWLAIMAYHRQVKSELELDDAALASTLRAMGERLRAVDGGSGRVLVKLQTIDWTDRSPVPVAELHDVARAFEGLSIALAPADDPVRVREIVRALREHAGVTPGPP